MSRFDEIKNHYDTVDDIDNGVFLKNKKYWYLFYGTIQYGYVSDNINHGTHDGSCKNRITYFNLVSMRSFKNYREISIRDITDDRKTILKKYATDLKSSGTLNAKMLLSKLGKTFPELVI